MIFNLTIGNFKNVSASSTGKENTPPPLSENSDISFPQVDGGKNLADVLDNLDNYLKQTKSSTVKTLFPSIDSNFPMTPGIFLLGALPAMGKSTFALNLAINVSSQNVPVLFVALEQSAEDLALKCLSRAWYLKARKEGNNPELVPTATDILLGCYKNDTQISEMQEVRNLAKASRKNFAVLEGRTEKVGELIAKIQRYVDAGVRFVVVDYIQILPADSDKQTARDKIDGAIRALQNFQQKNNLILWLISSFNRDNYKVFAGYQSFKESGGLEYTADGVFALQLKFDNEADRSSNEEFVKAMSKDVRQLQLVCVKGRKFRPFICDLTFNAAHDIFLDGAQQQKKNSVNLDK